MARQRCFFSGRRGSFWTIPYSRPGFGNGSRPCEKSRLLSVSLAAVLSVSLLAVQPASALTVFDPSNFVQNTLTAIRTLEQINNQINQLQNEAQMLMNQARNLANLDFNIVNRLRSTLAITERLIAEAQGLAYDVTNMDREFARLYPEQYAATRCWPAS